MAFRAILCFWAVLAVFAQLTLAGKFLTLSDLHLDIHYQPGTPAICDALICCRNTSIASKGTSSKAGPWGETKCDAPEQLIRSALHKAASVADYDYILWLGDDPPHNVDTQTPSANLEDVRLITSLIKEYFPSTPVFPAIGNHESYPTSQFSWPLYKWLMDDIATIWDGFLPAEALNQIKDGGFYTTLIAPKLRVISMFSSYYDPDNLFADIHLTFDHQLTFVNDTLNTARQNGEKVYIIGHIAPGSKSTSTLQNMLENFNVAYNKIINEHYDIILAQFGAHSHRDDLRLFKNDAGDWINRVFIVPSITTYTHTNPGWKIFEYDDSTFEIIDFMEYWGNYTQANEDNAAEMPWEVLYSSAKQTYGLPDLSAPTLGKFVEGMYDDETAWENFLNHYDLQWNSVKACDANCKRIHLCAIQHINVDDMKACTKLNQTEMELIESLDVHSC